MFLAIATGLFGLLGTVVGGVISYKLQTHQAVQARSIERERRADEDQTAWREHRRQASVEFVNRVDHLAESGREVCCSLGDAVSDDERQRSMDAYLADWRTLASGFAAFQLAVTAALNAQAAELYNAARDYSVAVDERVAGRKDGTKADRAQDALREARRLFIAAAQEDLRVPSASGHAGSTAA